MILLLCLIFIGISFLVLKPDIVHEAMNGDPVEKSRSLQRVREFASFIDTRPDLAQDQGFQGNVFRSLASSDLNSEPSTRLIKTLDYYWKQPDFEALPDYQNFIRNQGQAIVRYFELEPESLSNMNDQTWIFFTKTINSLISESDSSVASSLSRMAIELSQKNDDVSQERSQDLLNLYMKTNSLPNELKDVHEQVQRNRQFIRSQLI